MCIAHLLDWLVGASDQVTQIIQLPLIRKPWQSLTRLFLDGFPITYICPCVWCIIEDVHGSLHSHDKTSRPTDMDQLRVNLASLHCKEHHHSSGMSSLHGMPS